MIKQSFETGHHEWEKQNIVTRKYGKKLYDIYRCKHCGIEGKSYQIGTIVDDFIAHKECRHLIQEIDKISELQDFPMEYGIDEDSFVEYIHSYVSENHYDSSIHDIDLDWQTNNYEIVKMIIEEALSE